MALPDIDALAEDDATLKAVTAILARPWLRDRPLVDLVAIEASTAVEQAEQTITAGWSRSPYPSVLLEPPVIWDEVCSVSRSWTYHLHAWEALTDPLIAYGRTGDVRFLKWCMNLAEDWVGQHRSRYGSSQFAWYDMAVGMRAFRLAYLIVAGRHAGLLDRAAVLTLISSLRLHLLVLADDAEFRGHSNHGIYQAAGQLAACARLPELPEAAAGAEQGRLRLQQLVLTHFDEEGVHREHSPGYHLMVLRTLLRLRTAGLVQDEQTLDGLIRAEQAMTWLVAPIGTVPTVGDSDRRSSGVVLDPNVRDPGLKFALTQGREGESPPETFHVFRSAGYAVARDRWVRGAGFALTSYLLQSAGFHSRVHKHADDLSFVWYDRGMDLLTDAGRFGYVGRQDPSSELGEMGFFYSDPQRIYVETTRAHNCLEIDATPYPRRRVLPYGSAIRQGERDPETGVVLTRCAVTHFKTVRHSRLLFHLPGQWTLVVDVAAGRLGSAHDYVQRFHFGPALKELRAEPRGVSLEIPGASERLIAHQLTDAELVRPVRGQEQPEYLGFNSPAPSQWLPNWTVAWQQPAVRHARMATLLAIGGLEAELTCQANINATARAGQVRWRIDSIAHRLEWSLSVADSEHVRFSYFREPVVA